MGETIWGKPSGDCIDPTGQMCGSCCEFFSITEDVGTGSVKDRQPVVKSPRHLCELFDPELGCTIHDNNPVQCQGFDCATATSVRRVQLITVWAQMGKITRVVAVTFLNGLVNDPDRYIRDFPHGDNILE